MYFTVEIPSFVVPDNFFANTLFECVDLYINHELISAKASNADNYLTDLFITRQIFNQPYSNNANAIPGYYSDHNMDASEISATYITARRRAATAITKDSVAYYRYVFCVQINHGLGNDNYSNLAILKFSHYLIGTCAVRLFGLLQLKMLLQFGSLLVRRISESNNAQY